MIWIERSEIKYMNCMNYMTMDDDVNARRMKWIYLSIGIGIRIWDLISIWYKPCMKYMGSIELMMK